MLGGVDARTAMLAKPPEGQCAENGQRLVVRCGCTICSQDVGPDDGVAVQYRGAVRSALVAERRRFFMRRQGIGFNAETQRGKGAGDFTGGNGDNGEGKGKLQASNSKLQHEAGKRFYRSKQR